jgi:hypothetical protein
MSRRSEIIAGHIARAILNNTRKHWRSLHCDAVSDTEREIIKMAANSRSSCTTTNLAVGDNEARRTPIGRPISDTPADLAAHAPAKLAPTTAAPAVAPATPASGVNNRDRGMVAQMNTNPHSLPINIKPVDRKTLAGSTPGDHRAPNTGAGVTDKFKVQGGPRTQMPGQRNSRNYNEDGKGFQSTPVNLSDSEAGN